MTADSEDRRPTQQEMEMVDDLLRSGGEVQARDYCEERGWVLEQWGLPGIPGMGGHRMRSARSTVGNGWAVKFGLRDLGR